jgi:glycerophosphoryl diester phosphodiesterase
MFSKKKFISCLIYLLLLSTESSIAALNIQVGERPFYLIDQLPNGQLKAKLQRCASLTFKKTAFSIAHRGAPLQFPEHTKESYLAAARMGAGMLECDVTFTQDKQLVCRHSQCDLHQTTNILATPLAEKCTEPFTPADPDSGTPANAKCCTSDITLAEFKTLCGKMSAENPKANTVEEYLNGTPRWRTDLYANCGTLMSHAESIQLFKQLDVKMIPELKRPSIAMSETYTRAQFAQQFLDEYKGIPKQQLLLQSFNLEDILYWKTHAPELNDRIIFLEEIQKVEDLPAAMARLDTLASYGIKKVAPSTWMLVTTDEQQHMIPSEYARKAKALGFEMITWSLERSGPLNTGGGWYYQTVKTAVHNDGDIFTLLDVLTQQVGVKGIFSDWAGTVTYYANCMGLE